MVPDGAPIARLPNVRLSVFAAKAANKPPPEAATAGLFAPKNDLFEATGAVRALDTPPKMAAPVGEPKAVAPPTAKADWLPVADTNGESPNTGRDPNPPPTDGWELC